jgi:SAM-dependent methyltransferase
MNFARKILTAERLNGKRVLEVGSFNVNGSVRDFAVNLLPAEYVGVDISPQEKYVDQVMDACELLEKFGPEAWDVIISTEMLDHVEDWIGAIRNIKETLKPGGLLLLTARGPGFPLNNFPSDYWRFTTDDVAAIFSDFTTLYLADDTPPYFGFLYAGLKGILPQPNPQKVVIPYSREAFDARMRIRRMPEAPIPQPFKAFYHIGCMGHWKEVVSEQCLELSRVGIRPTALVLGGNAADFEWLQQFNLELVDGGQNLLEYETPTLALLDKWCEENPEGAVLYIHSKGVTNPGCDNRQAWRRLMMHYVVSDIHANLERLKVVDVVGVNWEHTTCFPHFSGNFWVARADWINSLTNVVDYKAAGGPSIFGQAWERMHAEMWLGSRPWPHVVSLCCENTNLWGGEEVFRLLNEATLQLPQPSPLSMLIPSPRSAPLGVAESSVVVISASENTGDHVNLGKWGDSPTPFTNAFGFSSMLGAHAPSAIRINVTAPILVRGFMNGSADYCAGVNFLVDGKLLGKLFSAYESTDPITLDPGEHVLTTNAIGPVDYCHSAWGFGAAKWCDTPRDHDVVIGAICKDENAYLGEWIRHHLSIGVGHVYLLDIHSKIPLKNTIEAENLQEFVTIESYPHIGSDTQNSAYRYLLGTYGPRCKWMALIDVDEFIIPRMSSSLTQTLLAYEEFGGIAAGWVMFGSDGRDSPALNTLKNYKKSFCDQDHTKCILQPRFVTGFENPHWFHTMPSRPLIRERFDEQKTTKHIQINNYWTRSSAEWQDKLDRGALVSGYKRNRGDFHNHNKLCLYKDDGLAEFEARQLEPEPATVPIHGFIHVGAMKHWEGLLREQIAKIEASGLYDKTDCIHICFAGISLEDAKKNPTIASLPAKYEVSAADPNRYAYEFVTLHELDVWCRSAPPNALVWYIHTKGTGNNRPGQKEWRNKMEEFVVVHHKLARQKLLAGYAAAGGVYCADFRWHIPGNFWWARADHVETLPRIADIRGPDRYAAEWWIASHGGAGNFYFYDIGDKRGDGWRIVDSSVGAGDLTTSGVHGWGCSMVFAPVELGDSVVISGHAPSYVLLETDKKLYVRGFTCGSSNPLNWVVDFCVNDEKIGTASSKAYITGPVELPPGRHNLRVNLAGGEKWGAHTCWSISASEVSHASTDSGALVELPADGVVDMTDLVD